MSANFTHGQFPFPQQFQDASARRVIEGTEKLGHSN
jgi:PKD repeat protein